MPQDCQVSDEFISEWDPEVHSCFTVVVADLGVSRVANEIEMTPGVGTALYRAPEANTELYDESSDILSLGIIAYELLTGYQLFTVDQAVNLPGLMRLWEKTTKYGFYDNDLSIETLQFLQYTLQK